VCISAQEELFAALEARLALRRSRAAAALRVAG
jgi:hypothetical protein